MNLKKLHIYLSCLLGTKFEIQVSIQSTSVICAIDSQQGDYCLLPCRAIHKYITAGQEKQQAHLFQTTSGMMEVNMKISSSLEKIVSPVHLATAIGVPSGAQLRLCRDVEKAGQSKLVVRCDKFTASSLRRRFSVPRAYAHDGHLTSLTFVGLRPITDQGNSLHTLRKVQTTLAPTGEGEGGVESSSRHGAAKTVLSSCSSSSSAGAGGVGVALDLLQRAEADGRRVPGIAELYDAFMRSTRKTPERFVNEEEKLAAEFAADEWTSNMPTAMLNEEKTWSSSDHGRRHRWRSGGEAEEVKGEEKQRGSKEEKREEDEEDEQRDAL